MLLNFKPGHYNRQKLMQVVEVLQKGGLIIFPTDTVYAIGCSISSKRGIERLEELKKNKQSKGAFSIICADIKTFNDYAQNMDTPTFKLLKKHLPGPFTFILPANNKVSRLFKTAKTTIGVRIPDHEVVRALIEELGCPLLSASAHDADVIADYITEPVLLASTYNDKVEFILDAGVGDNHPSTVVDCTNSAPHIIRQGKGTLVV